MDRELLEQVKEALEKATPGPWSYYKNGYVGNNGWVNEWCIAPDVAPDIYEEKDAQLIANAPTWLKQLIDMVEGLQFECDRLDKINDQLQNERNQFEDLTEGLRRDNEQLKGIAPNKHNLLLTDKLKIAEEALNDAENYINWTKHEYGKTEKSAYIQENISEALSRIRAEN